MQEFKPFKEGKVREVYDIGENLILVATDRISAFDHILKNKITDKGAILTQMSKFWFDYTKDIVKNHMVSVDVKDMPEFSSQKNTTETACCARSWKCSRLNVSCVDTLQAVLGKLQEERYCLWHQPSGRFKGIRKTA